MTELERLEYIKQFVNYDPKNGSFVWNSDPLKGPKTKGKLATRQISQCNEIKKSKNNKIVQVMARRLAWYIVTGTIPDSEVTTRNGNCVDDRFENLQIGVDPRRKSRKRAIKKSNSGVGVSFSKHMNLWVGEVYYLGTKYRKCFAEQIDAEVWVIEKRNELGFDGNLHGRVDQ